MGSIHKNIGRESLTAVPVPVRIRTSALPFTVHIGTSLVSVTTLNYTNIVQ